MGEVGDWCCNRCGFETTFKRYLLSHLQKKIECPANIEDVDRSIQIKSLKMKEKTIKCSYCDNKYSHQSSMSRHQQICEKNPKNQFQILREEITTLKDEISKLTASKIQEVPVTTSPTAVVPMNNEILNQTNTSYITSNSHNSIQQNMNTININNFGHETHEHLPLDFLTSCFMFKNMPSLVENTHFDPDCPTNHNIKLQSFKAKTVKVYDDGKWKYKTADGVLDEMINKGHYILYKHYRKNTEDIEGEMSEEEIAEVLDWLRQIDHKETKIIAPLKSELLNMLRNFQ